MITQLDDTNCSFCNWCKKMIKIKGKKWQKVATPSIARIASEKCSRGICPECQGVIDAYLIGDFAREI